MPKHDEFVTQRLQKMYMASSFFFILSEGEHKYFRVRRIQSIITNSENRSMENYYRRWKWFDVIAILLLTIMPFGLFGIIKRVLRQYI